MSLSLVNFNKKISEDNSFRKELEDSLTEHVRESSDWYNKIIDFARSKGYLIEKVDLLKHFNSNSSEEELRSQSQIDEFNIKIKELNNLVYQKASEINQFKEQEKLFYDERRSLKSQVKNLQSYRIFFWVISVIFLLLILCFVFYYMNTNKKINSYKNENTKYLLDISTLKHLINGQNDSLNFYKRSLNEEGKMIVDLRGRLTDKNINVSQLQTNYDNLNTTIEENKKIIREKNRIIMEKNSEISRLSNLIKNKAK